MIIQYQLNHHYWGFVKGHVEALEEELATAKREIMEEVGLENLAFYKDFRFVHHYQSKPDTNKEVIFFLAESKTKMVKRNPAEVKDSVWLSFHDAVKKLSYEKDRIILADANKLLMASSHI